MRICVEPKLGEEQHGYRKNRNTTDLLFALRITLEKVWEFNKSVYIMFIDLRKAFDSVPRERLCRVLEREYAVSEKLRKAIESLYKNKKYNVRTEYENKEWFEVKIGVKQGSVMSPILFIAYLDVLIRKVKEDVQDLDGDILAYADDLACWSEDGDKLRDVMMSFANRLKEAGLSMNTEKTENMEVGREVGGEELRVLIDGIEIKKVEKYKYFGGILGK